MMSLILSTVAVRIISSLLLTLPLFPAAVAAAVAADYNIIVVVIAVSIVFVVGCVCGIVITSGSIIVVVKL